ncbi:MAG TPA: PAS domain-containing protein [Anaeromyxobacter sp.]|nr:PAS domain-containing protein [Anaeromyxobacter sp.]
MRRRPGQGKPPRHRGTPRRAASPRKQRRNRIASDGTVLERLHELSSQLTSERALPTILQNALDAAIDLTGAQKGTLHLYDQGSHSLRLAAHRGFRRPFLEHFAKVEEGPAVFGEALRRRERVIVEDVSKSPIFLGTPTMAVMESEGVRAIQSTLVVSRDSRLLGIIATHFTRPHRPLEKTLRLLDTLARGVGILIEDHQREEALGRGEEMLRAVLDAIADPTFVKDAEGRLILINPATAASIGKPLEQIVGHTDRELYDDPAVGQAILEHDRQVMQSGAVHRFEETVQTPGGYRVFLNTKAPRKDASGRVIGLVGVARDVTEIKAAQARLSYLASFPEQNPYPIVEASFEGTVRYANPAALRLFPDIRQRGGAHPWLSGWESSARSAHEDRTFGTRDVDLEGRSFHQVLVPIPEDGVVRIYGAEITERKRAEEALRAREAELELILSGSPFMLTRCSRDLRYRYASRAYATMLGRTPAEIAGRPIVEVMGETGFRTILPHVEAVLRGELVEYDDLVHFAGIGTRRLHVVYVPDRDAAGQVIGWIASILDVTDQRRTEEELRAANARLLEVDRRRTEFLGILSHELRNPLAPIRNCLYVLERATPGGEQARNAQAIIDRQVGHMARLVEDLLDMTRVTQGKVQLAHEPVDLNDLVRRTSEDHRSLFLRSEVELHLHPAASPIWVKGDRTRLAQIVGNLLQNAAKFTPQGGTTTVEARADASAGRAIVTIRDTGLGITPEMAPRLFEPFAQADQTLERSKGGLGLGLALVKELVERHGGSVHAESEGSGRGSAFTVSLPLASGPATINRSEKELRPAASPCRVLVIEDNADAANSLRDLLAIGNHVVELASSGSAGIEVARSFLPEVVLCDIGLPGMDGYAVARTLRADPQLGRVPLVALTGYALPEDVDRALEAGFDAHMAKPPSPEKVEELLAALLPHRASAAP